MNARFLITYPDGRVEDTVLGEGSHVVGRDAADIILNESSVSGRHATIDVSPEGIIVIDHGSRNGTYDAADRRLGGCHLLPPGSIVRMGRVSLRHVQGNAVEAPGSPGATTQAESPPATIARDEAPVLPDKGSQQNETGAEGGDGLTAACIKILVALALVAAGLAGLAELAPASGSGDGTAGLRTVFAVLFVVNAVAFRFGSGVFRDADGEYASIDVSSVFDLGASVGDRAHAIARLMSPNTDPRIVVANLPPGRVVERVRVREGLELRSASEQGAGRLPRSVGERATASLEAAVEAQGRQMVHLATAALDEWLESEGQNLSAALGLGSLGTPHRLGIEHRCERCDGQGRISCRRCGGQGRLTCAGCNGAKNLRCGHCNGRGGFTCTYCHGAWQFRHRHSDGLLVNDFCHMCSTGWMRCPSCAGNGSGACRGCGGTGRQGCPSCRGNRRPPCSSCSGKGRTHVIVTSSFVLTERRTEREISSDAEEEDREQLLALDLEECARLGRVNPLFAERDGLSCHRTFELTIDVSRTRLETGDTTLVIRAYGDQRRVLDWQGWAGWLVAADVAALEAQLQRSEEEAGRLEAVREALAGLVRHLGVRIVSESSLREAQGRAEAAKKLAGHRVFTDHQADRIRACIDGAVTLLQGGRPAALWCTYLLGVAVVSLVAMANSIAGWSELVWGERLAWLGAFAASGWLWLEVGIVERFHALAGDSLSQAVGGELVRHVLLRSGSIALLIAIAGALLRLLFT